jgi:O-succinylbenzoic acid--CoA ligase
MPLYGSTVVLRREFEPGPAADDVNEHGVTCVSLVPTMLRRMLDRRGTLDDTLRAVLLGGAPAPDDLIERCRNYSIPVYPTYGMTETASQIATATPDEAYDDPTTVGRPVMFTDLTVVDGDGDPLPPGETGEFVVDGPTVSPGYDDPRATEASRTDRGLRTGDAGYVDDAGRVHVLNRLDDRIVTGGENVDPGEVVAALRVHPAVADAAVVGLEDEEWGERVAALVVRGQDAATTASELEAHLRDRLAGFKRPRIVGFADELPRTDSGTVDREATRERLRSVRTDPGPAERTDRDPTAADDTSGTTDAEDRDDDRD